MLFDRYPLGKSGIYPKEFKSAISLLVEAR